MGSSGPKFKKLELLAKMTQILIPCNIKQYQIFLVNFLQILRGMGHRSLERFLEKNAKLRSDGKDRLPI